MKTSNLTVWRFCSFCFRVSSKFVMKYIPSLLGVGQLSGSAGSNVASRNRNGNYIRTRVSPVNPRTTIQVLQRTIFATITTGWRNLTGAQRVGWGALGANIHRSDSLGADYTLTGSQAYMSVSRNLITIGAAISATAPAYAPPVSLLSITLTATSV